MRYPIVTQAVAHEYVLGRRAGTYGPTDPPNITYRGDGEDCVDEIDAMWASVDKAWTLKDKATKSGYTKDRIEGLLSVLVYKGLEPLPAEVLTDRDFWRYLATAHFFDFIGWRDGFNCKLVSYGCASPNPGYYCVPLRMFNRALISVAGHTDPGETDPFWGAKVAGTDLWRSHILVVLNGNAPVFVNGVLKEVAAENLPTDVLREFATGAKRLRANILFELLDPIQSQTLIQSQINRARAALSSQNSGD